VSVAQVIALINQMEADGVIDRYAVGGAVGATFYLEPVATLDVDIFVAFRDVPGQLLISPQPILDYLVARGGVLEGEYIVIAGWPVKFLPPTSPLVEEALAEAVTVDVDTIPARVFTAEYLAAMLFKPAEPRIKLAFSNSSRPAPSRWRLSKASSPGTGWSIAGKSSNELS
jgi:hypothetical protein